VSSTQTAIARTESETVVADKAASKSRDGRLQKRTHRASSDAFKTALCLQHQNSCEDKEKEKEKQRKRDTDALKETRAWAMEPRSLLCR